ncbi:6-phosphogluconolactonase [Acetobacter nitrogenifigens DSM 23921 = NBRC 105050]|uniref:6-phosphogluconolactonase n=1 Tax=Acetobacter nitrogenifigens DSM 23921 = NBRC 105050 TaxID=1120919 RepID=A0A511XDR6_9PROT|nr:6-phosphogluconolactonase [Acetobacter nitrogenifigens DSM 23921 = NBRC 105050]GEN61088.1 6-phosphogluconolactonase [Acetobacter nitrogenifigens DSM 23921 = NBRC 105050]
MSGHDVMSADQIVLDDAEAIARQAADFLLEQALAAKDVFRVALSGGSTPKRLYALMADPDYAARFPWGRVQFFFGDDRFVPADSPDSNRGMVQSILFSRVPAPADAVFPMPDQGDPDAAAWAYEASLKTVYGAEALEAGRPLFDVVFLGLGENGHTASLFPRQPVLEERTRWVAPCVPDDAPHTRLTLTYPAIASSRFVLFLVTGASKAEVYARVRAGDPAEPASHITSEGRIEWLVDAAAAGEVVS